MSLEEETPSTKVRKCEAEADSSFTTVTFSATVELPAIFPTKLVALRVPVFGLYFSMPASFSRS